MSDPTTRTTHSVMPPNAVRSLALSTEVRKVDAISLYIRQNIVQRQTDRCTYSALGALAPALAAGSTDESVMDSTLELR